jgi:hypothetical protein
MLANTMNLTHLTTLFRPFITIDLISKEFPGGNKADRENFCHAKYNP